MASLTETHWETITPDIRQVMAYLGQQSFIQRFYMAGGTALALQIGHRRSLDLDFFSEMDEVLPDTQEEILKALATLSPKTIERAIGNLVLEAKGVRLGFFSYGYPLVEPTQSVEGIALASPMDIGLMKLDAIISRASRKDFYDLYFIAQIISLDTLLEMGETKYPFARDFEAEAVRGLVFFENADRDIQPDLLIHVPWDEVKEFFRSQAKVLAEKWLQP